LEYEDNETAAVVDGAVDNNDENNKTNCREVGHNIYILAQQVLTHVLC